ncbi:hypothetical protein AAC387_Pa06g2309 [Persea americana]
MIDGYGKKLGDVVQARKLFDRMPKRDLVSWNSMIDGYAAVGDMSAARTLFEEMPERNVISWSIMIDGYARHKNSKESLNLFQQMLCQGTKPDKVSTVGAIIACAQLGALDQGRWIHIYMKKNKVFSDIVVQTALIDMYMKCGSLEDARAVFKNMSEKNMISWNVMIVGLGINGHGEEALELFSQMERNGTPMDDLTFLGVLTACSHAGQTISIKKVDKLGRLKAYLPSQRRGGAHFAVNQHQQKELDCQDQPAILHIPICCYWANLLCGDAWEA